MANYYTVRDSKTGEIIRKTAFGTSISDAKLQARAKTVKKNIASRNVSYEEAQKKAQQDLELIARAEQLKAANIKAQTIAKAKNDIIEALEQKKQAELQKIDKMINLSTFQKEQKKRDLLNISTPTIKQSPVIKFNRISNIQTSKSNNIDISKILKPLPSQQLQQQQTINSNITDYLDNQKQNLQQNKISLKNKSISFSFLTPQQRNLISKLKPHTTHSLVK